MSVEQAELVLRHMQVPKEDGLYILGCFEKRVTLRSQQVRALNLICALDALGALKSTGRIAVVGGGAAGMTAAAGAARLGYEVTLLEKKDTLLPLFRGNNTRWLHPHIYDWPETPGETRHDEGQLDPDEAGLPLLSWRADLAGKVADQFDQQWRNLPERSRIHVVPNVQSINLGSGKPRTISWNAPGRRKGTFDAVILAVGFGIEKPFKEVPLVPYWDNERWHQPTRGGTERYLVSGCGDGGLIDLLRLKLKDFRHEDIVRRFLSAPGLESLTERLKAIEKEARTKETRGEDPGTYLEEQYEHLVVPDEVDKAFELRTDTEVTLNGRATSPLTLRSSILNRFLTSRLLYQFEAVPYREGEFTATRKGDSYEVRFKTGKPEPFHHVICRHGPALGGALGEGFPELLEKSGELQARNELDQTRKPLWTPGFFDRVTDPRGETPPSRRGGPDQGTSASDDTAEAANEAPFIGIAVESLKEGFKGRERTLEKLHALLRDPSPVALTGGGSGRVFAHGGGGIGKSRLAIEYAYRYRDEYPGGVFFARVEKRTLQEVWAEFARALFTGKTLPQDEEAALAFAHWLENATSMPRLLVFDDVQAGSRDELAKRFKDRVDVRGHPIWPLEHRHVSLLMTTRMRDIPRARGLAVDRLDAESARALLIEKAAREELPPGEQAAALELASEVLGGHPLAISLAGAYIRRGEFSFSEYLVFIREKGLTDRLEAAARAISEEIRDHERSIAATYELSSKQLDSEQPVDVLAMCLLQLTAFLEPGTPIDRNLLRRLLIAQGQTSDLEQIGLALARLTKDLALLDQGHGDGPGRGEVIIHPLIADYTRWGLEKDKRQKIQHALLLGLCSLFPNSSGDLWKITRRDAHPEWEHLSPAREAHVAAVWNGSQTIEAQTRTILSWSLGELYFMRGSLSSARSAWEEALKIAKRLAEREPDNAGWQRDLSVSLNTVGEVLLAQGNLEAALKSFEQGLEIAKRLAEREPDNAGWQRDVSVSLDNVGGVLRARENLEAALNSFEQSLEIRQRLAEREPDNAEWQRDVSVSLNKVGGVLLAQGNLEAALKSFEQGLEIAQRLAEREPDNARWQRDLSVSLDNVGGVLLAQENLEEALKSFEQSLEIAQRLAEREPDNAGWQRDVSVSLDNVGDVLREQGNLEAALKSFEQSLEIAQRLAEREPDNAGWQTDLVLSQVRVADILAQGPSTDRIEAARLLISARDTLLRLAASSRLIHAQQHQWLLPAIAEKLRMLDGVDSEEEP
jgi:tetratricopeptide (TPR) repeat protein